MFADGRNIRKMGLEEGNPGIKKPSPGWEGHERLIDKLKPGAQSTATAEQGKETEAAEESGGRLGNDGEFRSDRGVTDVETRR